MQNKCVLSELCKHHDSWVRFARNFDCGDYSEDIVQEFYLRVNKYQPKQLYIENGINLNYAFWILRNLILTYLKARSKAPKHVDINERLDIEFEDEIENKQHLELIIRKTMDCVHENVDSFDSMLFEHYLTNKTSYRQIAKGSGLSTTTVYKSLNKTRKIIENKLKDEYKLKYGKR